MPSETKAASDTHLQQHESASLLVPLQLIPSIASDHIRKYRSGNNLSTREKIPSLFTGLFEKIKQ